MTLLARLHMLSILLRKKEGIIDKVSFAIFRQLTLQVLNYTPNGQDLDDVLNAKNGNIAKYVMTSLQFDAQEQKF